MPTSRSTKQRSPASKAARPTASRAARARRASGGKKASRRYASAWTISVPRGHRRDDLPGWSDLAKGKNERVLNRPQGVGFMARVSTLRFALLIFAIAAAFTVYVGHVYATQDLLTAVQEARKENQRLHMHYNQRKAAFDQATSPTVIYRRARALGLEEQVAYGPTIRLND